MRKIYSQQRALKRWLPWSITCLLLLLAFSQQGYLNGAAQKTASKQPAPTATTEQGLFQGKIYFTSERNLYVLDGLHNLRQLTHGVDVRDPAVSPDGRWIAFIARYRNYSDLVIMPTKGGPWKVLRTGAGQFLPNPGYSMPRSSYHWYAQPAWAADSQHLLFLSDFQKAEWNPGVDAFLLDLQIYSLSIRDSSRTQNVAYAAYGDGGNRDPSYRPHHPDQVIYTYYAYDQSQTRQIIQLHLTNANTITRHPEKNYRPGIFINDPSVALTPSTPGLNNLEPAFSPDGNSVAYVRRGENHSMGLYIMPVAENVTNLPSNADTQKKALAPYSKSSLIIQQRYISQPCWSPDGRQIVFLGYTENNFDLWLVSISTDTKTGAHTMQGEPVPLTDTHGHLDADSRPFWTP